jgi:hypothetical protein
MANTYIAIATVTVGSGGASTIEFTSIPNTFTDLSVLLSTRSTDTGLRTDIKMTFNGSRSSYSGKEIRNADGTVSSTTSNTTYVDMWRINGTSTTASTFTNHSLYIPNYASSNNKSFSIDDVLENNSTSSYYLGFAAGLWSNSSAINQITFTCGSGNFAQYSTATLYGIKNS